MKIGLDLLEVSLSDGYGIVRTNVCFVCDVVWC
jgi:hypothetical protein